MGVGLMDRQDPRQDPRYRLPDGVAVRSHRPMIVLRVIRGLLILAGLIVLVWGFSRSFGFDNDGNTIAGDWSCGSSSDSTVVKCQPHLMEYGDTQIPATCLAGLGLICAAIALGQFEGRTEPRPQPMAMNAPAPGWAQPRQ
jgi:hypothetical protein